MTRKWVIRNKKKNQWLLIRNPPGVKPPQMRPLLMTTLHPKHHVTEEPKQPCNRNVERSENRPIKPLVLPCQRPRDPIEHEPHSQDGEVESRIIMVHVGDSCHGHKWKIMQHPAYNREDAGVMNVVYFRERELFIATLPAYKIPEHDNAEGKQRKRAAPVHERIAEKEVFYDAVVPAAHAEADIEDGPLPELRGKIILFVGVRDKRIVGCHHGDVEMHEIAEERRFIGAWITSGHCIVSSVGDCTGLCQNSLHFSFQWDSMFQ